MCVHTNIHAREREGLVVPLSQPNVPSQPFRLSSQSIVLVFASDVPWLPPIHLANGSSFLPSSIFLRRWLMVVRLLQAGTVVLLIVFLIRRWVFFLLHYFFVCLACD